MIRAYTVAGLKAMRFAIPLALWAGLIPLASGQQPLRPFTVADDIELTHFDGGKRSVSFSADGNYFAVWAERGRLKLNRVEDSLRFYRSRDINAFLGSSGALQAPSPVWTLTRLSDTSPAIDKWRWLPDSSGIVFLHRAPDSHRHLLLADLATRSVKPLTPATEDVENFEIHDRNDFVYRAAEAIPPQKQEKQSAVAVIGTGRTLSELLFVDNPRSDLFRSHVWKVSGGVRVEIKGDEASGLRLRTEELAGQREHGSRNLEVTVQQGLNAPPLLVARNSQASRVLWDPNPQLKALDLGQASVYKWTDNGMERRGGLYKPSDYRQGQRYPLVFQTHDFDESSFSPAGSLLTSSYAARAMAAAGIVVLQVGENCPPATTNDGPCAVSAYESAVKHLVSDGVADPDRVGIVAFSWPSFYVMKLLTTSNLHVKAALIASGQFMGDYFQFMALVDNPVDPSGETTKAVIGGPPFGQGLQQWLAESPSFHLDHITSPVLMVAQGRWDALLMWGPYSGLRYLHKPVDLVVLRDTGHVLTNPKSRLLSQGGTVDWFRFWLQGYEDPDPAKADQYKRWHTLRDMQSGNTKEQKAPSTTKPGS